MLVGFNFVEAEGDWCTGLDPTACFVCSGPALCVVDQAMCVLECSCRTMMQGGNTLFGSPQCYSSLCVDSLFSVAGRWGDEERRRPSLPCGSVAAIVLAALCLNQNCLLSSNTLLQLSGLNGTGTRVARSYLSCCGRENVGTFIVEVLYFFC